MLITARCTRADCFGLASTGTLATLLSAIAGFSNLDKAAAVAPHKVMLAKRSAVRVVWLAQCATLHDTHGSATLVTIVSRRNRSR